MEVYGGDAHGCKVKSKEECAKAIAWSPGQGYLPCDPGEAFMDEAEIYGYHDLCVAVTLVASLFDCADRQ